MATLIKIDKNGTKYFEGYQPCDRCGGKGVYIIGVCNGQPVLSPVDGGQCFKCGGTGKVIAKWKEYTPEHEAKLEKQRQKRREKQLAEIEATRKAREEAEAREREEAEKQAQREAEERAKSQYIGTIGDKIEIKATYLYTAWFEGFYGTTYIHNFKAGDNAIIWKTSNGLMEVDENSEVTLKGTIKEHSEYNGQKQTVLTRCKIK